MRYLTLDILARKANLMQSNALFTPAPVFAANMAMHALDKKLQHKGFGLGIHAVGLIHNDATPWIETIPNARGFVDVIAPNQRRGAAAFEVYDKWNKSPQSNSAQPKLLGDVRWTIVVEHEVSAEDREDVIARTLMAMRLAGGVIERARVAGHADTLAGALLKINRGYWIDDVSYRLLENNGILPDCRIERLLRNYREGSWVVPVNLGYALIEEPCARFGARDGRAHAFAEHMIGLIQFSPINEVKDEITPERLWRYGWVDDQFVTTNSSDIHSLLKPGRHSTPSQLTV